MKKAPEILSYPTNEDIFQYITNVMIRLAHPIRNTDWIIDLALTGAAGFLRFALWAEPGASNNIMGERWTYSQEHTDLLIGRKPPQGRYSKMSSALSMAAAAYSNARQVSFERDLFW